MLRGVGSRPPRAGNGPTRKMSTASMREWIRQRRSRRDRWCGAGSPAALIAPWTRLLVPFADGLVQVTSMRSKLPKSDQSESKESDKDSSRQAWKARKGSCQATCTRGGRKSCCKAGSWTFRRSNGGISKARRPITQAREWLGRAESGASEGVCTSGCQSSPGTAHR